MNSIDISKMSFNELEDLKRQIDAVYATKKKKMAKASIWLKRDDCKKIDDLTRKRLGFGTRDLDAPWDPNDPLHNFYPIDTIGRYLYYICDMVLGNYERSNKKTSCGVRCNKDILVDSHVYNTMYQDLVSTIMKYVEMEEEKLNG